MVSLEERLEKLTPQQRKLFQLKLNRQWAGTDVLQPITRVDRENSEAFPLSFAQERLWFIDQMEPGNPAYNIVRATAIEGGLDSAALKKSLDEIIHRHEILRTIFIFADDEPKQVILPVLSIPLTRIDLCGLAKEKQILRVKQVREKESLYSFDLGRGPLLRTHLLELSPVDHIFLLVIHHIISDGISAEIFLNDLIRFYQAFSQGKAPGLPALSIQYVDYACWQQRCFGENAANTAFIKQQEQYWLKEFSGETPVLGLPIDFPRPVMQNFEGDIVYFTLGTGEQESLREMVLRENTTLFIFLLSIYNIFLSKVSGMEDIVVGSPVAGRRHTALQNLVGIFVNTLPLRNFPGGDKRFKDFLLEVKERTLKTFDYLGYRYEDIIKKVSVTRDTGRNPLFDVAFVLQNQEEAKIEIPGLRFLPLPYEPKTSKFDLSFEVIDTGDNLRFSFEYCTKLFKEETIQRLTRYFKAMVTAVVENPGVRLSEIEITGEEEKHQLVVEFNQTEVSYPEDKTIHRLFEEQVCRTPDNIVVISQGREEESGSLTYRELNNKSDQLARFLRAKGLTCGTIAAIMGERSIETVTGMLAILKAGGAYLPIDPAYPEERIDFMLKDSGVRILLTDTSSEEHRFNCQLSIVNCQLSMIGEAQPATRNRVFQPATSLAYIIYTSGSTGRPKGVSVEHGGVVNTLLYRKEEYHITPGKTFLQLFTFAFDGFVTSFFTPVISGACVVFPGKPGVMDVGEIKEAVINRRVTHFISVPALYRAIIEHLSPREAAHLEVVTLAGDRVEPGIVETTRQKNKNIEIACEYGVTEVSVLSTIYRHQERDSRIKIGKPIWNTQICIMNRHHQLLPVGIPGELCISGVGVSRGYLNNPELTAERYNRSYRSYTFYKTGDLARWLPDGNIEFLGRIDQQLKIRGFRIEPGEIAGYLQQHEDIKEAVVTDRESENRERHLCVFFVPVKEGDVEETLNTAQLRSYLADKLPAYMIPSSFVKIDRLPVTPNGKVDVNALRRMEGEQVGTGVVYAAPRNQLEKKIRDAWQEVLGLEKIGIDDNFFDLGGTSLGFVKLSSRLKNLLGEDVPVVTLFQYPTVGSLAHYLNPGKTGAPVDDKPVEETRPAQPFEVAVIGMALRVPGSRNSEEFWENLKNGVEGISFFTSRELKESGVSEALLRNPKYVKAKGVLEDKQAFDYGFFDYTPAEAEVMDPQIRLFHEYTWEALENAGYTPGNYRGKIGLYAGATQIFDREMWALFSETGKTMGHFEASQLIKRDFLPTRVSYKLNLTGPALLVQSACSTSLVAIHMACRALINGECDMAAAGGVTLHPGGKAGHIYQEGMILSSDGHCRAFDASAKGTMNGEGIGIVILKRLSDALNDGDTVRTVVKGSAINNDGIRKAGYTAPGVEGQCEVIKEAHRVAGVEPESITYVETHGTGTALGDLIEIKALNLAFDTSKKKHCAIGSVKSNVGHLDSAAGVVGFIKTVLSLEHELIPPSLFFETPNPGIDFENSPFYVNTRPREWKSDGYPHRAGVSSFGIGGTNAHAVLEKAPGQDGEKMPSPARDYKLILLSAKSRQALDQASKNLAAFLKQNPGIDLADAAYTLQVGRKAFPYRRMLVSAGVDEVREALSGVGESGPGNSRRVSTHLAKDDRRSVIFMFSGLGSQYVNMGLDLYRTEPVFREAMERCFEILDPLMGYNIKEVLYPSITSNRSNINQPEVTQPLIFAFEYSLAKLLMHWGIMPDAMIGYSFGEYAAACLAGVFSLEDALKLIAARGQLIQRTLPGAMLSVPLPIEELKPLLDGDSHLSIAIDNGPSCIVAGAGEAIENFEKRMKKKRYMCMPLQASRAIHSFMMEPILNEFEEQVARLYLKEPQIPLISNVSGHWLSGEEAVNPAYWVKHLRGTVRFADGVNELMKKDNAIFVEIGPGRDLTALLVRCKEQHNASGIKMINLVRPEEREISDVHYLLNKIGLLWLYGITPDWGTFYTGEKRRRIPLPTYPFQRQTFSVEGDVVKMAAALLNDSARNEKNEDMADWFYIPSWKQSALKGHKKMEAPGKTTWLLFIDECGFGEQLAQKLKKEKDDVIIVKRGVAFSKISDREYRVNPEQAEGYFSLICDLSLLKKIPQSIVHLWSITGGSRDTFDSESVDRDQYPGFYSLIYLAQAIRKQNLNENFQVTVISNNMQEVTGEETLCPGKSTVLGPLIVIPQEFPNIVCRSIDIVLPPPGSWQEDKLVARVASEISIEPTDTIVAYRNHFRWVQTFEAVKLGKDSENLFRSPLRKGGVYLVTGGLGRVGFALAQHLARTVGARLILTGRSVLPPREEWEEWLAAHDNRDGTSQKILEIRKIEEAGGEVMTVRADAANLEQMKDVIVHAEKRFGPINGVIHAAGIIRGDSSQCAVENVSEHHCREQFQPKVYGLIVLETVLKNKNLDFCLLMSSLSCVLGGLGFSVYSAANIFMDAFARKHNRSHSTGWISVNWDGWQLEAQGESEGVGGMLPGEGEEAFQRILNWGEEKQVVVSVSDLQPRIDRWIKLKSLRDHNAGVEDSTVQKTRPDLTSPYTAPRDQVEQTLVNIWQKFFGFDQVGIEDDFFELGGDSLKAITLIARIQKEMNVRVPLPEFFKIVTVSGLASYIKKTGEDHKYVSMEPVEEKEYYPLSPSQKRMYILNLFMEYNIPLWFEIEGNLDRNRVEEIFRELIKRHESLRTSFHTVAGEEVQKIHNHVEFKVETEADRRIVRPFDLSRAPLIRVGLIKSSESRHLLLVNIHHLISDGVSLGILSREFVRLYRGEELPELNIRYRDFSQWQNRQLKGEEYKRQEGYWLDVFSGEIPVLNMALDYPRPAMQSFEGRRIPFTIEGEAFRALKKSAIKEGASLYMVLLALYNTLLFRYTGQDDIVIGTISAGREQRDVENIVGIFINPLAMRNRPAKNKTFQGFLAELKQNTLEAHENQLYPFGDLLEKVVKKKDHSRNPLFDVMLIYQNRVMGNLEVEGLRFSGYEPEPEPGHEPDNHTQQDMTLWADEGEDSIRIDLEYCTALFKQETMERFVEHFLTLLKRAGENPKSKLSELEIMTDKEKQQILFQFNDTETGFPVDRTIHQLFEEQVEKFPDRIAGITQNREGRHAFTYRELNENANQLTQVLRNRDVKPGTIVGIMPERSIQMLVGVMGILKAGGAYLPIDPQYPEERIQYMLKDSGAKVLLKSEIRNPKSETNSNVQNINDQNKNPGTTFVLNFENLNFDIVSDFEFRVSNLSPSSLAYVIYTSGSTGKPKGVVISHDRFVNAAFAWIKEYRLDVIEVNVLQLASFSFDVFSGDMARALLTGGKLVICPEDMRLDFPSLYSLLKDHRITFLESTPSLIFPFMEYIYENRLDIRHLQLLILGADICPPEDFKRLLERFMKGNPMRILNSYGVTEATIDSSYYEEHLENLPVKGHVPIGKPLPNVEFYILDPAGNLQPVGVPGELYIGGKGVAPGYLNNPELTNSKFQAQRSIARPLRFSGSQLLSFSLYRTGDLARWLSDGNVEFLGRIDYQVKIRGFRVELGEIENRLLDHNDIKEAAVLDKEEENGNKYLCAYIVPAEDKEGKKNDRFTVSDLKTYLFGRLPDYMIPSQFIEIDEIPLTPNGKIDNRALLALEGGIDTGIEYAAPTNEVEKKLADLWAEILDKDRVGIYDNFFDLGGQSLKAMRLMAMIRETFHVKIPLVSFFQVGTVKGIAGLINPLQQPPQSGRDHSLSGIKFKKKKRKEVEL